MARLGLIFLVPAPAIFPPSIMPSFRTALQMSTSAKPGNLHPETHGGNREIGIPAQGGSFRAVLCMRPSELNSRQHQAISRYERIEAGNRFPMDVSASFRTCRQKRRFRERVLRPYTENRPKLENRSLATIKCESVKIFPFPNCICRKTGIPTNGKSCFRAVRQYRTGEISRRAIAVAQRAFRFDLRLRKRGCARRARRKY